MGHVAQEDSLFDAHDVEILNGTAAGKTSNFFRWTRESRKKAREKAQKKARQRTPQMQQRMRPKARLEFLETKKYDRKFYDYVDALFEKISEHKEINTKRGRRRLMARLARAEREMS